jgi:aminopeptidase N
VVYQLAEAPIVQSEPYYKLALQSDNLLVRQAVATTLTKVPSSLKTTYESLLTDKSYATREAALYHLWSSFPDMQKDYLEQSKTWVGFHNKNIRQLWLALAIVTNDYKPSAKPIFKEELRNFTSDLYSFEVRQSAFNYVNELSLYTEDVVNNLINACTHHNWRFREASRKQLTEVLQIPGMQAAVESRVNTFTKAEQAYLQRIFPKK